MKYKEKYIETLEWILSEGSIRGAARKIGLTHKAIHKRLATIQRIFSEKPLTISSQGSKTGGTFLTTFGFEILKKLKSDEIN